MQVVSLKIKNFLSISDAEIKPGQINQIIGKNNQGKTSIIKAIEFAAKGSSDASLVKFGEEAAEVFIEFSDQTMVRRRLSAEGKQVLDVKKDGFKAQSPQALLDSLFDSSGFKPLELLDPKKRNDAILASIDIKIDAPRLAALIEVPNEDKLPPLNYDLHGLKVIDHAHRFYYQRRAEANKTAADKKKRFETYKADLPKEEAPQVDRASIEKSLADIENAKRAHNAEIEKIKARNSEAIKAQDRYKKYLKTIEDIDAEIAKLQARKEEGLRFVEAAKKEAPETLESDAQHIEEINALNIDAEKLKTELQKIEKFESIAKQREMVALMEKEYSDAYEEANALTAIVDRLGSKIKTDLMEAAEMPIAGLEYKDENFFIDGVPVDNLSSSKAMKLAIGVARKVSKKSKLICIDGAEMLDSDTYKSLLEEINGDGFTYFVTTVGTRNIPDHKVIEMQAGRAIQ